MAYHSPWISQLKRMRPTDGLTGNKEGNILIVGGGIAGVSAAFFSVTTTDLTVLLIEADVVAHGATGHNAGQVVSYFERPFHQIVDEFGLDMATSGQKAIMGSWDLLDEMYRAASLKTPLTQFQGYTGYTTIPQLVSHLRDVTLFDQAGIPYKKTLLVKEDQIIDRIPSVHAQYCTEIPRKELLQLLETRDEHYLAASPSRKGCLNSALLCEELVGYLLSSYSDQFQLVEHTPVEELICSTRGVTVNNGAYQVCCDKAVLCTNGFTGLHIRSGQSPPRLPAGGSIKGVVGYMAGYIDRDIREPMAVRYFPPAYSDHTEPYFYLTRRQYEQDALPHELVCVGGPEVHLPGRQKYRRHDEYLEGAEGILEEFIWSTYRYASPTLKRRFLWHGLMGYTEGNIRIIGADPDIPSIHYNLGCNGVGILPSIYGGWKIARLLDGDIMAPSIFDPQPRKAGTPPRV